MTTSGPRRAALTEERPTLGRRDPAVIDRFLGRIEGPLNAWFRPVIRGLERVPAGRALVVANHNGGILMPDVFVLSCAWRRARGTEDLPYALGHDQAMSVPYLGQFLEALGGLRATADAAHEVFRAGHKVLAFPGGDLENYRPFRDRNRIVFGTHRGYVRLAIREGVPICPVVTAGGHSTFVVLDDGKKLAAMLGLKKLRVNVCPTVLSIPWGLTVGFPPPYVPLPTQMWIEALEPIHFTRSGEEAASDTVYVEACHAQVVGRMQTALDRLSSERREARRDALSSVAVRALDWLQDRLDGERVRAQSAEVIPLHTVSGRGAGCEPAAPSLSAHDHAAA